MAHISKRSGGEYVVRFGSELQTEVVIDTIADAVIYAAGAEVEFMTFSPAAAEELAILAMMAKSATAAVAAAERCIPGRS